MMNNDDKNEDDFSKYLNQYVQITVDNISLPFYFKGKVKKLTEHFIIIDDIKLGEVAVMRSRVIQIFLKDRIEAIMNEKDKHRY